MCGCRRVGKGCCTYRSTNTSGSRRRVASSSRRRRHASSRSSDKRARDDGPNKDLCTKHTDPVAAGRPHGQTMAPANSRSTTLRYHTVGAQKCTATSRTWLRCRSLQSSRPLVSNQSGAWASAHNPTGLLLTPFGLFHAHAMRVCRACTEGHLAACCAPSVRCVRCVRCAPVPLRAIAPPLRRLMPYRLGRRWSAAWPDHGTRK